MKPFVRTNRPWLFWGRAQVSSALLTGQIRLFECEIELGMKSSASTEWKPGLWKLLLLGIRVKGWVRSAFFLWAWKGACLTKTGRCARELHNGRQVVRQSRRNTSVHVSCDTSPLYLFHFKEICHGGWWMALLRETERAQLSPQKENDYFSAKWFGLETHLNLLLRWNVKPILKHRSYAVTELLLSYRLYADPSVLIWCHLYWASLTFNMKHNRSSRFLMLSAGFYKSRNFSLAFASGWFTVKLFFHVFKKPLSTQCCLNSTLLYSTHFWTQVLYFPLQTYSIIPI